MATRERSKGVQRKRQKNRKIRKDMFKRGEVEEEGKST